MERRPVLAQVVRWALLLVGLAACAGPTPDDAARPAPDAPGVRLTAVLTSPTDVTLSWTGTDRDVAGRIVEFATEPDGRYTILQFMPPGQTSYQHADLIPETAFYYRVRPYVGPASEPVEVAMPPGPLDDNAPHDWADPRTIGAAVSDARPIRDAGARPTGLVATVMHANGLRFTWTDHASDEEGYLLEVLSSRGPEWTVVAVLDPDVNSFGIVTLPEEKRAAYRVRAFRYGPSSNVAHQTTGR
jgi:hypothetical protein